mmetsp:Transcript_17861/g.50369  ORF Transcript_17861/g.50369 Transcript_17861/m.50369 type:complete len:114 (-) Transcript_17861:691-1032(-)
MMPTRVLSMAMYIVNTAVTYEVRITKSRKAILDIREVYSCGFMKSSLGFGTKYCCFKKPIAKFHLSRLGRVPACGVVTMKLKSWCSGAVMVETITEQLMSQRTAFVESPTPGN